MSAMVPTLPTPKPYVPRSHAPMIPAAERGLLTTWSGQLKRWVHRCPSCRCSVSHAHVPDSETCHLGAEERDRSVRR